MIILDKRKRVRVFQALIDFDGELSEIVHQIDHLQPSQNILVTLDREKMVAALEKYLADKINERELATWAFSLTARAEIGFGSDEIASVVNELANDDVYGPITKSKVRAMLGGFSLHD